MRNGCSDRLSRAEPGSLTIEEVLDLYEGQIDQELVGPPTGDEKLDQELARLAEESRQAADQARAIYATASDDEAAITVMLASENEVVRGIGEALDGENYGKIAI